VIINKETREKAQKRWQELKGTWPVSEKKGFLPTKKLYPHQPQSFIFRADEM